LIILYRSSSSIFISNDSIVQVSRDGICSVRYDFYPRYSITIVSHFLYSPIGKLTVSHNIFGAFIIENGGEWSASLKSNTTHLVTGVGGEVTVLFRNALEKKIEIVSEQWVRDLVVSTCSGQTKKQGRESIGLSLDDDNLSVDGNKHPKLLSVDDLSENNIERNSNVIITTDITMEEVATKDQRETIYGKTLWVAGGFPFDVMPYIGAIIEASGGSIGEDDPEKSDFVLLPIARLKASEKSRSLEWLLRIQIAVIQQNYASGFELKANLKGKVNIALLSIVVVVSISIFLFDLILFCRTSFEIFSAITKLVSI
jgi:hypothetical protein